MRLFDLQMFALEIEGIDQDILDNLAGETTEEPEEKADEATEETTEETKEEPADADADSDNKQVEQEKAEEDTEEEPENGAIPYSRFKDVNTRRKEAEARVKELEEQLKGIKQPASPAPEVAPEPAPANTNTDFNSEQMEQITKLAMKRAAQKMNMSDEDLENLEFSDNPAQKMMFQASVNQQVQQVIAEVKAYQNRQAFQSKEAADTSAEFEQYNQKFNGYADAAARWAYIAQEKFNKLPKRKQYVLNESFTRLQHRQGTYQDMEIVSEYFNQANAEWEGKNTPTDSKAMNKIRAVENLPKASGISGGSGTDKVYSVESIKTMIDTGRWEELPTNIQKQVLEGRLR